MINYSQVKPSPKLLLQFSRNEQVPKLVSIHQIYQKQNRNKLLQQARIQAPSTQPLPHQAKKQFNPDLSNLRHNLQEERQENEQLRSSIKELTRQLQKLREVNEGLIVRIKQVENSYRLLKNEFERTCQQQLRKQRVEIYNDVEEYVRIAVQKLTLSLRQEKMTPVLEDKLERFMAQLLEINAVSVQQHSKRNKESESVKRKSRIETVQRAKQSRRVDKYLMELSAVSQRQTSKQPQKQQSRQQYASIMQRLTGQNRMSKSFAVPAVGTVSQDTRFRTVYATTPQKRRKIFD